jgi:CubicO group peptidase (beta-lactamase class C family)
MNENSEARGFNRDRLQRINVALQADIDARKIPGAVVLIARHNEIAYWKAFGYRDRESNVTMQRDDLFRIASMTKPITSVAVMMLAERGAVLLADPIAKYLSEFAETKVGIVNDDATLRLVPQARPITIQDLLRHTAGLTYGLFGASPIKTAYNEASVFDLRNTNQQMVTKLAALPLAHQPGEVWDYSMCTDVLGRLVEVLSTKTLGDFFTEEILSPLAMHETAFLLDPSKASRMAQPQVDLKTNARIPMTDHTISWPWQSGGAGLYSTAPDYLNFCQMLLNRGKSGDSALLAPSTLDLMTADHLHANITYAPETPVLFEAEAPTREMGQGFGYGFAVRTQSGINPLPGTIGDYFWAGALGTYFWIDPAKDLIVIFFSQAPEHRLPYRYLMRQLVYQALED